MSCRAVRVAIIARDPRLPAGQRWLRQFRSTLNVWSVLATHTFELPVALYAAAGRIMSHTDGQIAVCPLFDAEAHVLLRSWLLGVG